MTAGPGSAGDPAGAGDAAGAADAGDAGDAPRDRARDSVDHLQAAARELIAAARAALDVAEQLVDDPQAVSAAVGAAGKLASLLRTASSGASRRSSGSSDRGEGDVRPGGDDPGFDPGGPKVERITVR